MKNKTGVFKSICFLLVMVGILTLSISPLFRSYHPVSAQTPLISVYLPLVTDSRPNIFGISIDRIDDANGLTQVVSANADWVRRDFPWEVVEPTEGARDWSAVDFIDQEFIAAHNSSTQVVGILGGTPAWAQAPNWTCKGKVSEEKFAALAAFAGDLVRRYSVSPYQVMYWELWNEPDVHHILGCWGDLNDPLYYGGGYYGQMLKVVYPAMKAANPDVQVVIGGLLLGCDPVHPPNNKTCTESRFLEGILAGGAGNYFDGVAFHAYDYSDIYTGLTFDPAKIGQYSNLNWSSAWNTTGPVTLKKAAYIRDLLKRFGFNNKFLMNTEIAVVCGDTNEDVDECAGNPEAETTKAYYVVQSLAASLADGYLATIWYSAVGRRGNSLLTADLTPLPAYYAYQFTAQTLGRATYVKKPNLPAGVMGYEFTRNRTTVWVVWAVGPAQNVTIPKIPTAVNRFGPDGLAIPETPSTTVSVGTAPVIIEFPG